MKNIWGRTTARLSKKQLIIIAGAMVLLAVTGYHFANNNDNAQEALQQKKTITVAKGDIEETISGSGTIEAIDRKEIASECTGTYNEPNA